MKNKKLLLVAASALALGVAFFIASKLYQDKEQKRVGFIAQESAQTFIRPHSPRMGAEEPQVYLVEFLDPECESCREFSPLVKSLMNEFEGKIQLIIRYAPFHGNSVFAIQILEAARKQEKYWETLDLLFRHQPEWGSHHDPRPELIWNFLPQLGLDIDRLKKDMEDPQIKANIQQDQSDAQNLNIRGTPSFFVNGKPLQVFSYAELRSMIASEIK